MKTTREDGLRQNKLDLPDSESENQGIALAPPPFSLSIDTPVQAKLSEEADPESDFIQMKGSGNGPIISSGSGVAQRATESGVIQRSSLSEELATVWVEQGKGAFFERLRNLNVCDIDVNAWIDANLSGDDHWLASNITQYGPEAGWPIHLKVEREMKGWGDSGGKGVVFELLRTAAGAESANASLSASINGAFAEDTEDRWLAINLQLHGAEANWPIHLKVEREMKGWADSGGIAVVFELLRTAAGAESANADLTASINGVFAEDTEDRWLAINLQLHGAEANWPIHLKVEREMKGWADSGGKGVVFELLRTAAGAESANADLTASINAAFEPDTDDRWLASKLQQHGVEANWPIHFRCEREMKGWADSGGKGVVFDILRTANGAESANATLAQTLRDLFAQGTQDLMLALRLQSYGPEANFPAAGDQVNPPSGQQVETWITANAFLNGYIGDAITGGLRVDGNIFVHTPAEFRTLFIAYGVGRGMTNAAATTMAPNVNAYRDGSEVHMCLDRGEIGTAIHESIHFYSHDDYRGQLGSNANEGTTEYFTRVITAEQGIVRGNFYSSQRGAIDKLVALVTQTDVADAYFDGEIDDLRTAVDAAKAAGTFNSWVTFMKASNYASANALL